MSAESEQKITNTHDQLVRAGGGVAIIPAYSEGRTKYFRGWAIYRVNADGKQVNTDPNAHWSDYGKKTFSIASYRGTLTQCSRAALDVAKKWVAEQGWYDGEWMRNQMRDYVPKEVNKQFPLRRRTTNPRQA